MESFRIIMTSTFYPPYHLGGDATHVAQLKAELQKRGHEVHVLHSLDAFELKKGRTAYEPQEGALGFRSSLGKYGAVSTYLTGRNRKAERLLAQMVDDVKPDWVHHHNISLLGQGVLSVGKAPKLYTAHDYWLACPRSDLMYLGKELCRNRRCTYCSLATSRPPQLWRAWQEKKMTQGLQKVIAPSNFVASKLREFLGIEAVVMPHFVSMPSRQRESGSKEAYFSFIGTLEKSKGLDLLLDVFTKGKTRAGLHIMGQGSMESEVKRAERESGGRISYKGFLTGEALWSEIASSRALIAPSRGNETSSLVCVEALSLGVPLIVSARGALPELVDDIECGIVVPLDADAIEAAIDRLANNDQLRNELSRNAMETYLLHHDPHSYVRKYLELGKGSI